MTDIHTVSRLLHAIGDFERIGDHAQNIQESAEELHEKDLHFSDAANAELQILIAALRETREHAFSGFAADDPTIAMAVEPLEETIDHLIEEIRIRHIHRLQAGECTIQLGFVLTDLLTNMERVSDHCSNIAVSIVAEHEENVSRHAYLSNMHVAGSFAEKLNSDLEKYKLP
jgi:phosphate:Na+ symporter